MPDDELTVQQMIDALERAEDWVTRVASIIDAAGRDRVIAGTGADTVTGWHVIATMNFVNQISAAVRAGLEAMDNRDEVVLTADPATLAVKLGPLGKKLHCDGPTPIAGIRCAMDYGHISRRPTCGTFVDLICGFDENP